MARPHGSKDGKPRRRRTKAEIELAEVLPPDLDIEMPLYGLLRRIASDDPEITEIYKDTLRIAVLPYLHAKATPRVIAKPYFLMTDQELIEVRRLETEHEHQIEISRRTVRLISSSE